MGSKCSISLINAEAVIFHQYLSRQGREEALVGIQFGLGAFNQTISHCMMHNTNLRPPRTLRAAHVLPWLQNVRLEENIFAIKVTLQSMDNIFSGLSDSVCRQITLFCKRV